MLKEGLRGDILGSFRDYGIDSAFFGFSSFFFLITLKDLSADLSTAFNFTYSGELLLFISFYPKGGLVDEGLAKSTLGD